MKKQDWKELSHFVIFFLLAVFLSAIIGLELGHRKFQKDTGYVPKEKIEKVKFRRDAEHYYG